MRPTGATSGSVNDGSGNVSLSGPRSASITQYGLGKPDAVVAEGPQMVSWESRRDTLRHNMLGRKMPAAASRRENAREASCRTLSLIFAAPQSVGRTLLRRGTTAVGWHALADEARSVDPTSLGARSSTPQRVNRLRRTMGQEHSGHGAIFIRRAAAHESSWVLDSPGSSTRNTEAPPGFLCRRRCDTNNPALLPLLRVPLPQPESTTGPTLGCLGDQCRCPFGLLGSACSTRRGRIAEKVDASTSRDNATIPATR